MSNKNIEDLFQKPEIPISINVKDSLSSYASQRDIKISNIVKIGIYVLLKAEENDETDFFDNLRKKSKIKRKKVPVRKTTVRIPYEAHEKLFDLCGGKIPVTKIVYEILNNFDEEKEALYYV